jgi:hypothetical protein
MMPAHTDPDTEHATNRALLRTTNYYAIRDEARNAQAQQIKRFVMAVIAPSWCVKRVVAWILQHWHTEWPSVDHRPSRP